MGIFQELIVESKTGHNVDIATYVHDKLAMADARIARIEKEVLNKASRIFYFNNNADTFTARECDDDYDLLYIAVFHSYRNIVNILLEHGVDIRPSGWNYGIALNAATIANSSSKDMASLLIGHGANPNHWNNGSTPLHWAITHGHGETARMLLEHGADVNALDGLFDSALSLAVKYEHWQTEEELEALITIPLQHGATINRSFGRDMDATTILHDTASTRCEGVVRLLLDHGADVNARGGTYDTALQAAAVGRRQGVIDEGGGPGWLNVAKALLDYGADVNARGGKYGTALQAAAT
ncbi:ankyrin repeat-containing domain protein, partial [Pseudoneurospora amorphoporcata]